jgi:hypothetical protein
MAASDLESKAKEAFVDDDFELAAELYSQAIDAGPATADLYADRAQAHIKLGNYTGKGALFPPTPRLPHSSILLPPTEGSIRLFMWCHGRICGSRCSRDGSRCRRGGLRRIRLFSIRCLLLRRWLSRTVQGSWVWEVNVRLWCRAE